MLHARSAPLVIALAAVLAGCHGSEPCGTGCGGATHTTTTTPPVLTSVLMDFAGTEGFYASPFPNDARTIDGFPNPNNNDLANRVVAMIKQQKPGFGLTSGVFFALTAAIDPAGLPTLAGSVAAGASVSLIGIDPSSPDYLHRYPISVGFLADGGPYGAPNLLALLEKLRTWPRTRLAWEVVDQAERFPANNPIGFLAVVRVCLLYTSPSPRD